MGRLGYGAVAIIDALGFKGIWTREDPLAVLGRLKSLRREGLRLQGHDGSGVLLVDDGFTHRVKCVSDTIVVTVTIKGRDAPRRGLYLAMHSASLIAGVIIDEAIVGSPPLLFRGSLCTGEMKADGNFMIGPAIDEAAQFCEAADGPFFWLAPSAMEISNTYAETFLDNLDPTLMLPYKVPLRNGSTIKTLAFGYFGLTRPAQSWTETRKNIIRAFGSAPLSEAIIRKKDNMVAFLRYVDRVRRAGPEKWTHRDYRLPDWEDLSSAQRFKILAKHGFTSEWPASSLHTTHRPVRSRR